MSTDVCLARSAGTVICPNGVQTVRANKNYSTGPQAEAAEEAAVRGSGTADSTACEPHHLTLTSPLLPRLPASGSAAGSLPPTHLRCGCQPTSSCLAHPQRRQCD